MDLKISNLFEIETRDKVKTIISVRVLWVLVFLVVLT